MENSDTPKTNGTSELIILFRTDCDVFLDDSGKVVSRKGKDTTMVNDLLKKHNAVIKSIGPESESSQGGNNIPSELRFFVIKGAKDLDSLRLKLLEADIVDSAYIKPPAEDPGVPE